MHEQFLLAALDQAWLGRGICAPNPSVGAVAVHNEKIIAQTWHRGAGTPHAEKLLLDKLPKNMADVTLYVTLEPCNHWGRTPPCVEAIISYGIKKVVYAYRDPNPIIAANNTPHLLQQHGVDILHYPLAVIEAFYRSYHHWMSTKKPWVTVKIAQSMDGKIGVTDGERIHLSNANCDAFTHQQRSHSDVILTTARTINLDNPLLNARSPDATMAKTLAIIDRQGILNPKARVLASAKHCLIYQDQDMPTPIKSPNCSFYPVSGKHAQLDLESIILHLGSLGYHDVWVEAGGMLFSALHQAHLVNKTYVYIVPQVLGDAAVPAYYYPDIFKQASKVDWQAAGNNMIASFDWLNEEE